MALHKATSQYDNITPIDIKHGIQRRSFQVMACQSISKMATVRHLGLGIAPPWRGLSFWLLLPILLPNLQSYAFPNEIQDGRRPPSWNMFCTSVKSSCIPIVNVYMAIKFGRYRSNTFQVMSFQIKSKMAAVRHLGLCLVPHCKVGTIPLDVLTLRPNLEYVAQILFKLCHFKWNSRWRPFAILEYA
jgi:hypothetical protein